MRTPGDLLASGRDADIYECGPALVLRRSREGRSMATEARTMTYLHQAGYPVPAVEEVSEDGTDLVMERINGPSMVQALGQAPWTVRRQAAVLAELHGALHDIGDPGFLPAAPLGAGTSMLHLDLHPLNVILGNKGPVVIDWSSASVGDPDIDVGLAWVLMAAGEIPGGAMMARLLGWGRNLLVNGFLAHFDRRRVAGMLRAIAEAKVKDPHMSAREAQAMWRVVARAERRR